MNGAALQVSDLCKRYGDQQVLAGVGLEAAPNTIVGLIGPNGAGKTTLLDAIAGLLPVDSGIVRWHGAPLPQHRRRDVIFYLPDGVRPYADQHAGEVLQFFANVYRRSPEDVGGVIAAVGLDPALTKRVHVLSKGFNRRLLLAIGLLTPQPVLMMDEPFDGFDLRQSRDMMRVLARTAQHGRSLVLSIHQLGDAERICDRFVLLSDGQVRGAGTLGDLRARTGLPHATLEEVFLAVA